MKGLGRVSRPKRNVDIIADFRLHTRGHTDTHSHAHTRDCWTEITKLPFYLSYYP